MVNGRDAPCNADPQEDVHRVTSGHVPHARVGVLVLACGHLARERVCNKITYLDPTSSLLLPSLSSPPSLPLFSSNLSTFNHSPLARPTTIRHRNLVPLVYVRRVGWHRGGCTRLEARARRKLSAELAARRDSWQHIVYTNFQFTLLRAYKTNLVREQVYIYIVEIYW